MIIQWYGDMMIYLYGDIVIVIQWYQQQMVEKSMSQRWMENSQNIIKGSRGQYKIDKKQFLGRGGFGIVYVALRKWKNQGHQDYSYMHVVLKQFKKSDKWRHEDDWDRQLIILRNFLQHWDNSLILDIIDIFKSQSGYFYLVTKYANGGSLSQRIKNYMREQDVIDFVYRSAKILNYLHCDVMRDYRAKEKGEEQKEGMAIIHRDFKPANLVFVKQNQVQTMFLIDFGIAKVGYTNYPKNYSNCGTNNYKAPQIGQSRIYNAKVDIYSFGCTLYEIFSCGQKLLGGVGMDLSGYEKEMYIKSKLIDLEGRLLRWSQINEKKNRIQRKINFPLMWIQILVKCLQANPSVRWSSKDLLNFMQRFHTQSYQIQRPFYFTNIDERQRLLRVKRDLYELNFQIYRINVIQDIVFTIFQYYYFQQPRLSKFVLYVILKYIAFFLLQKFVKAKDRAKLYDKTEKYNLLKKLIDEKRLKDIRDKGNEKIKGELAKEVHAKGLSKGHGKIQSLVDRYPQLLKDSTVEPRRTLFQFCFQVKSELQENQRFGQLVGCAILLMDQIDHYQTIYAKWQQFQTAEVEVLSLKRLYKFKIDQEEQIKKLGLNALFISCQVERSVKSGVNKEEKKSDVQYQLKEKK